MGVAIGDYDGDGYPDIFITGYDKCVLYHNNGNGTFTDVTAASGITSPGCSTTALWFDYNNDGKLDLFVAQFVDYSSLRTCGQADLTAARWIMLPPISASIAPHEFSAPCLPTFIGTTAAASSPT